MAAAPRTTCFFSPWPHLQLTRVAVQLLRPRCCHQATCCLACQRQSSHTARYVACHVVACCLWQQTPEFGVHGRVLQGIWCFVLQVAHLAVFGSASARRLVRTTELVCCPAAQVRQMAATALVGVQMAPVPDQQYLHGLAAAIGRHLQLSVDPGAHPASHINAACEQLSVSLPGVLL